MKRVAFLVLCVLAFTAAATLGNIIQLAATDESLFPAPATVGAGSLMYGTDAGAVYVVNNSSAWTRVQGASTSTSPYGYDFGPNRYCIQASMGSVNPLSLAFPAWAYTGTTATYTPTFTGGLYTQMGRFTVTSAVAANSAANFRSSDDVVWRGNSGDEGGFFLWMRASFENNNGTDYKWLGILDATTALACPATLANILDTVYVGCEAGSVGNYQMCSNDNSGTATCTDLGAGFPCTTVPTVLDFTLTAQPNSSSIDYVVRSLLGGATATGTLTTDLPRNTVFLAIQGGTCNGATGGAVVTGLMTTCAVLK